MAADRSKVENFIYHEARLMDENRYDEWLALWTSDALYWVPCGRDDADPKREVSLIYDDHTRLETRIRRLNSGVAHAQDPKSRMRRVISNLEIEEESNGEVNTASNFILAELRRGVQDVFAGRTIHRLRPENGSYKLVFKKVLLVNNDEYIDNLTFLV
ncbi:MAG: aromatic-ring-hydroxylating dioxygenase subunit beta [Candidatus Binataceae bacterium]|nr:aromatic-ring-hydroxylating dioxygenase subunit beta [Candidatus Binataceae bacterium]